MTPLLFLLAAAARLICLQIPFVEPYNSLTRQAIVAMVARNFYDHGFNLFWPEVDNNGAGVSLFDGEFQLYSYLMAIGYKLVGGPEEWVARLVSVIFSMAALFFLHRMIRDAAGARAAFWGTAFAAFTPMFLALSRSIQPEAAMFFGVVTALWAFGRYESAGRMTYFYLSAVLAAFAVATKIQSLPLLMPIAYLAWRKEGARGLFQGRYVVFVGIVALALVWYAVMWHLSRTVELAFAPLSYVKTRGPEGAGYLQVFFSPYYLKLCLKYLVFHILTPVGCFLFWIGLRAARPRRENAVFYAWLASVGLYALLLWRILIDHAYYQAPLILPAAFFVGVGVDFLWKRPVGAVRMGTVALTGVLLLASIGTTVRLCRGLYQVPEPLARIADGGKRAEALIPKEALVAAAYGSSPIQLYYCHRRGWQVDLDQPDEGALIASLERLRKLGAGYFMTTQVEFVAQKSQFLKYLKTVAEPVETTDRLLIYRFQAVSKPA